MEAKKVAIVFRYDDYSNYSLQAIEEDLINIFHKYDVMCTFGVIPFVTNGNFRDPNNGTEEPLCLRKFELLKGAVERKIIDIALHGYSHQTNTSHIPLSEFAGLSYNEQLKKISIGKAFIEKRIGVNINTFIPPWNTYDENTLKALYKTGISNLSADRYGICVRKYNINYIPLTIEMADFNQAIQWAEQCKDKEPLVIVNIHPYDFYESDDNRAKFATGDIENFLEILLKKNYKILSISQLIKFNINVNYKRFVANKPLIFENIAPQFVKKVYQIPFYGSLRYANQNKKYRMFQIGIFYSCFFLLSCSAGNLFRSVIQENKVLKYDIQYGIVALILLFIYKLYKNKEIYFRGFFIFILIIAFLTGTIMD